MTQCMRFQKKEKLTKLLLKGSDAKIYSKKIEGSTLEPKETIIQMTIFEREGKNDFTLLSWLRIFSSFTISFLQVLTLERSLIFNTNLI